MSKEGFSSWHLQINGLVQGIGFRPYVYLIAKEYDIHGVVKNGVDGVHINFNATQLVAKEFKKRLCEHAPPHAKITSLNLVKTAHKIFNDFNIVEDHQSRESNLILTSDMSLCHECRHDIQNPSERRFQYAFTSCTRCGPRFSILNQLPYDRENTEMKQFLMCDDCLAEYRDPSDRRFYAQTNSCPNCAIQMSLISSAGRSLCTTSSEIIKTVVQLWSTGNLVAIKGIGGYLLTCDATNIEAVREIRLRKNRPTKPLAVMLPDLSWTSSASLDKLSGQMLEGSVAPIVLIPSIAEGIANEVNVGHDQIGVMLPYTPLFDLLLRAFNHPIVATSANVSGAPIIFKSDKTSNDQLGEIADYILTNNREILIPQDDSVLQFSRFHHQKIIFRRSRGLAPSYVNFKLTLSERSVFSTGAQLKSTFGFLQNKHIHLSQYLGDLDDFDAKENYNFVIDHLQKTLKMSPEIVLSDLHKGYSSSKYGMEYASSNDIPILFVQHHKAHFCAILGEHNLLEVSEPILGVIWDGTGLGEDGSIWGSEFFLYQKFTFERCNHLSNFQIILSDKMAKEPRLSALSLCCKMVQSESLLKNKFTDQEWNLYLKILNQEGSVMTSSVGRLFDGVASLLDLMNKQSYEGEAAMQLEQCALQYYKTHGLKSIQRAYDLNWVDQSLNTGFLIEQILSDLENDTSVNLIAARFHYTLVLWIEAVAKNNDCDKIAFSGGVFQNSLLVDLIIEHLQGRYKLYFHEELSPNDENIAFGQLIYHEISNKREK